MDLFSVPCVHEHFGDFHCLCLGLKELCRKGIDIRRKADRGHRFSEFFEECVVAAAHEHRFTVIFHVGTEYHAGIIIVSLYETEIDHKTVAEPEHRKRAIKLFHIGKRLSELRVIFAENLGFGENFLLTEKPRQTPECFGVWGLGECCEPITECGVVFRLDHQTDILFLFRAYGKCICESLKKAGITDLQSEILRTCGEGIHRRGNDL